MSDTGSGPGRPPKPGPAPEMADPDAIRARVDEILERVDAVEERKATAGSAGAAASPGTEGADDRAQSSSGAELAGLYEEAHRVLAEALSTVDGI